MTLHSSLISTGIAPYTIRRMVESSTSAPEDEIYIAIHELARHTDEMYQGDIEATVIRALADGHWVDLDLVLDAMAMVGVGSDLTEWAGCSMRHQATSTSDYATYPYRISGASSVRHSPRQLVHRYRPEQIHMGICTYEGQTVIGYEREYLPENAHLTEVCVSGMVAAAVAGDYDEVQRYYLLCDGPARYAVTVRLDDEDAETVAHMIDARVCDVEVWTLQGLRDRCSELAAVNPRA